MAVGDALVEMETRRATSNSLSRAAYVARIDDNDAAGVWSVANQLQVHRARIETAYRFSRNQENDSRFIDSDRIGLLEADLSGVVLVHDLPAQLSVVCGN